jgi:hypothetical protein
MQYFTLSNYGQEEHWFTQQLNACWTSCYLVPRYYWKTYIIDYLKSGMQINLCVAIDYTASNGEISEPSSLHFLGA